MLHYKKILSPIVNWAFYFLIQTVSIFLMMKYEDVIGFHSFSPIFHRKGFFELTIIVFIVSLVFFGISSKVMQLAEKIKKPKFFDHFRQAALLYVLFVLWIIKFHPYFPIECETDCHGLAFLYIAGAIPLFGILINATYLLWLRRR